MMLPNHHDNEHEEFFLYIFLVNSSFHISVLKRHMVFFLVLLIFFCGLPTQNIFMKEEICRKRKFPVM